MWLATLGTKLAVLGDCFRLVILVTCFRLETLGNYLGLSALGTLALTGFGKSSESYGSWDILLG